MGETAVAKKAEDLEKALLKRMKELCTIHRKQNVLCLASQGSDSLSITGEEWDQHPLKLACKNGVIDLETGDVRPGRPEDYIKTAIPAEWKGSTETCPSWEWFIADILEANEELVSYVQRFFGYSITGSVQDHVIPIFHGEYGRNGKSTLFETLSHVLGPIAGPIQVEMLLSDGRIRSSAGPSPDIMSLRGRRLAWASETAEGRRLAVDKVKLFTGNDTLVGRPPHGQKMIEFRPTHKLVLLTNHRPEILSNEYALWERISLIPFNLSYVDIPKRPFERRRDPMLPEKLKAEASGILAWLVRGCLEWQKVGLCPPDIVRQATTQYQEDEDLLGDFIKDNIFADHRETVRAQRLYSIYKYWCQNTGIAHLGGKKFGEQMGKRFERKTDSNGRYYKGIKIRTTESIVQGDDYEPDINLSPCGQI